MTWIWMLFQSLHTQSEVKKSINYVYMYTIYTESIIHPQKNLPFSLHELANLR